MQTKHKASPAFDTLFFRRVGARTGKVSTRATANGQRRCRQTWLFAATFADRGASTLHEMERKVPLLVQKPSTGMRKCHSCPAYP